MHTHTPQLKIRRARKLFTGEKMRKPWQTGERNYNCSRVADKDESTEKHHSMLEESNSRKETCRLMVQNNLCLKK